MLVLSPSGTPRISLGFVWSASHMSVEVSTSKGREDDPSLLAFLTYSFSSYLGSSNRGHFLTGRQNAIACVGVYFL